MNIKERITKKDHQNTTAHVPIRSHPIASKNSQLKIVKTIKPKTVELLLTITMSLFFTFAGLMFLLRTTKLDGPKQLKQRLTSVSRTQCSEAHGRIHSHTVAHTRTHLRP